MGVVGFVAAGALVLSALAGIDFNQPYDYAFMQLLPRIVYYVAFFLGGVALLLRSATDYSMDSRAAPWLLYGLIVAVGMFLVHNLVDFALFDPSGGPLFVFMLIAGGIVGARDARPSDPNPQRAPTARLIAVAAALSVWLAAAVVWVAPLVQAEQLGDRGAAAISQSKFEQAARAYREAFDRAPVSNASYLRRAVEALIYASAPRDDIRRTLDAAIDAHPSSIDLHLLRARHEAQTPSPDYRQVLDDLLWSVQHNPNDASLRLEYADMLARTGDAAGALEQYRKALLINEFFAPDEPRRLAPERVIQAEDAITRLERGASGTNGGR
jgi:tetratricopeptide (TPR) repeat protein